MKKNIEERKTNDQEKDQRFETNNVNEFDFDEWVIAGVKWAFKKFKHKIPFIGSWIS